MDTRATRDTIYIQPLSTQYPTTKPAEYYPHQPPPPPPPPNYVHPPMQQGSFDFNHKDKPQTSSVGAGK